MIINDNALVVHIEPVALVAMIIVSKNFIDQLDLI